MNWKIPLFKIYWDKDDVDAVKNVIERGTYWAEGPEIAHFEEMVAKYIKRKHAISFANGTAALHAQMLAHGIGPGNEIIVPSFTFISTVNSPLFTGAKPVFADIESETYGLDPDKVEKAITKKTKAIMPVHYGGHPCEIKGLKEVADNHNLLFIEDAAESLGAHYEKRKVGAFGDSAMFSFCQNKIITTGEGGIVVTDNPDLAQQLKLLRSHGRSTGNYFGSTSPPDYIQLGFNLRMPSTSASLGVSQMKKLEKIIEMRRKVARAISDELEGVSGISLPVEKNGCRHVFQMFTIRLPTRKARDKLQEGLAKKGIMSRVYFDPVHLTKFYRERFGYRKKLLPVTEKMAETVLSLPIYANMNNDEIEYLVNAVNRVIGD